jgi:uncharacterized protein DUF3108
MRSTAARQALLRCIGVAAVTASALSAQQSNAAPFPYPEKLDYHVEWRLITAGMAHIDISRASANTWETKLKLQSAGFVTKLYQVNDSYRALTDGNFCGATATLDAQEGKRHRLTTLNFNNARHKLLYDEKDLLRNKVTTKELDMAPCTHEIVGALSALRMLRLDAGKTATLPVSDGKKMVSARIEGQERETVVIGKTTYHTIRYEAFLFDNVLYQRRGRLWVWMTDDASRLPVQIRVRLAFPIGNITLMLDKDEH